MTLDIFGRNLGTSTNVTMNESSVFLRKSENVQIETEDHTAISKDTPERILGGATEKVLLKHLFSSFS